MYGSRETPSTRTARQRPNLSGSRLRHWSRRGLQPGPHEPWIEDLALLPDCHVVALVERDLDVRWHREEMAVLTVLTGYKRATLAPTE